MKARIYTITLPSGKFYVGSAVDYARRISTHRSCLRRGVHKNPMLQAAWNKYGVDGLVFQEIICCDRSDLLDLEQWAIDNLHPQINVNKVANSRLGILHTDQAKAKMSAAQLGRKTSEETRKKLSAIAKAKRHSDEVLRKMRDGHRKMGPQDLAAYREKMAIIKANRPDEKTKAMRDRAKAMGKANRGRLMSPEEVEKRSASQRRRYERDGGLSESAKEKLRVKRGTRSKPNRPWTLQERKEISIRVIKQMADQRVAMLDWILEL